MNDIWTSISEKYWLENNIAFQNIIYMNMAQPLYPSIYLNKPMYKFRRPFLSTKKVILQHIKRWPSWKVDNIFLILCFDIVIVYLANYLLHFSKLCHHLHMHISLLTAPIYSLRRDISYLIPSKIYLTLRSVQSYCLLTSDSSVFANLPRILGWLSARAFRQAYWKIRKQRKLL